MASAQVVFYQALQKSIMGILDTNNKPVFKQCLLWNNQLPYNEKQESFGYPCVFIEFASIEVRNLGSGWQNYTLTMRFHVGFANLLLEDLSLFEIKDALDQAIVNTKQSVADVNAGSPGWIPLNKQREEHDSNDSSVYIFRMEYAGTLTDKNTSSLPPLIVKAPPTEFEAIKEIVNEI